MIRLLVFAIWVLSLSPIAAWAHAFLAHATPAAGSQTRTAPPAVTLTFSEAVEPRFSTIEVRDPAGTRVDSGAAHPDGGGKTLSIRLPPLAAGQYTVIWHATSVDTHQTEGRYTFTVLP